jgi:hypothetical protein
VEDTDLMLKAHKSFLHAMFSSYAHASNAGLHDTSKLTSKYRCPPLVPNRPPIPVHKRKDPAPPHAAHVPPRTRHTSCRFWLGVGEFQQLMRHLGLVELGLVTHSMVHQVFVWSRIRSIKDTDDRQEMRIRHLFFEDFLEVQHRVGPHSLSNVGK